MGRFNRAFSEDVTVSLDEVAVTKEEDRGALGDVFMQPYLTTSLLISPLWFSNAFIYYGCVLYTPLYYEVKEQKAALNCSAVLKDQDFTLILGQALIELFGQTMLIVGVLHGLGRISMLKTSMIAVTISCAAMAAHKGIVELSVIRGSISAAFALVYMYTSELYPTYIRSIAMGTMGSISRIGGVTAPIVSEVLMRKNYFLAWMTFAASAGLATTLLFSLPETNNKPLPETAEDVRSLLAEAGKEYEEEA